MLYLDTSVLVPLVIREPGSESIRARLGALPAGEAAVSDWALVEFASALGTRVRAHALAPHLAREAGGIINDLVDLSCTRLAVVPEDFALARRLIDDEWGSGLRAGDALHLAVVLRHRASLLTADLMMLKAARRLAIPIP